MQQTKEEQIFAEVMSFVMANGINTTRLTPITAFQHVPSDIRMEVFVRYNNMCKMQKEQQNKKENED